MGSHRRRRSQETRGMATAGLGQRCSYQPRRSSIFTLWTDAARKSITDSRILTTRNLVEALCASGNEKVLINASGVGYYGSRLDDEILDEDSAPGAEFMSRVSIEWEDEAKKAARCGTKVALCRFGIVLGRGGGALSMMLPAFRYLLGGSIGSGSQWMSWIHQEDLLNIFSLLLSDRKISGPVNCGSPKPVRNAEFAKTLARTYRPLWLSGVTCIFAANPAGRIRKRRLEGAKGYSKKIDG